MTEASHPVRAFLVGPTGVGKTDVAILLARAIDAEILGVDARQIYRDLTIGTAKPTPAQRRAVRHHLIDRLDPRERCSAGRFLGMFREAVEEIRSRGRAGLAVGGAGLYVDACLGRFHDLPPADEPFRARALAIEERDGPGALHRQLQQIDPATASRLAPRDLQRIVRALEVAERAGRPLSQVFATERGTEAVCPPETPLVLLDRGTRELYARIEARCEAMLAEGLVEEVRRLLESGVPPGAPGMKSVGYAEWIAFLQGRIDRDRAHELFLRNSRRYAKRQRTWFRNRHPGRIDVLIEEGETPETTAGRVLEALDRGPGAGADRDVP